MKKNLTRRLLPLLLALSMFAPMVAMASNVPDGFTCSITVSIEDDKMHKKVVDTSSKYLTGDSPLALEVVSLIKKNYDEMYVFRSPAMKKIMDEGLRAFRTSDDAWDKYLDKYYDDVGSNGLKEIVSKKTSTVGELVPNQVNKMTFKNDVKSDPKYGTTYTVTIMLNVKGLVNDPDVTGVSKWLETEDHIQYLFGYPDDTFGPGRNMTRAEAAQMFYSLLLNKDADKSITFSDVSDGDWFGEAVHTMAAIGILSGYPDGTFLPNQPITRAEFTTMAMKFTNLDQIGVSDFSDVSMDNWFYNFVVGASKYGWISGYPDGTFLPNANITRTEVTCIVNNMLGRFPDEAYISDEQNDINSFVDLADSYWGYYPIMEATNSHDYTKDGQTETWTDSWYR